MPHPDSMAPRVELFLLRHGFSALSCPPLLWQQSSDLCRVFSAGVKPLPPNPRPPPEETQAAPGFHGGLAEPGVSSDTCPISSIQA